MISGVQMGRVLITMDDGRKDLSDLRRYGVPEVLFRSSLYPDDADERLPHVVTAARKALHDFDWKTDSIALVGDPLLIAAIMAVASERLTTVPVLKFDSQERQYYRVLIDLRQPHLEPRDNIGAANGHQGKDAG